MRYLHSEIDTLERIAILRDLRKGVFDVLVGINLLREGLDLPEVSLVGILDADKEGYLRSEHVADSDDRPRGAPRRGQGHHVRRRRDRVDGARDRRDAAAARTAGRLQPRARHRAASVRKEVRDILDLVGATQEKGRCGQTQGGEAAARRCRGLAAELEKKMNEAAANLEFEKAAALRDELIELRKQIGGNESVLFQGKAPKIFSHALKEFIDA